MPFRSQLPPVSHLPLKGVNLGSWLLLEKWITPSLFVGTDATDEYTLCAQLNPELQARLQTHRETFIARDDFMWLKQHGIDAVRVPVGYWVFGDEPPFLSTIEYVDRAFQWAAETGIYILLDLHGAPGTQNGWEHSGRAGEAAWASDEAHIIKTLQVLQRLAQRYAKHPQLLGFELLNEPKWTLPRAALLRYYQAAYKMLRAVAGPHIWIIFHDNFRPRRWKRHLRGAAYDNVIMDTHQYQIFDVKDKRLDLAGHLKKTTQKVPKTLNKMRRHHHIMIGEWSLTLDGESLIGLDEQQRETGYRAYGAAQLLAYSQASAWFYWTYRTESSGPWNFYDVISRGWLPTFTDLRR